MTTDVFMSIKVHERERILTITLDRADKLNAFAGHMRRDLGEALERAASDDDVRVVVITGAGRQTAVQREIAVSCLWWVARCLCFTSSGLI